VNRFDVQVEQPVDGPNQIINDGVVPDNKNSIHQQEQHEYRQGGVKGHFSDINEIVIKGEQGCDEKQTDKADQIDIKQCDAGNAFG